LASRGIEWGLIGPGEADRIWERHIENCIPVTTLLPEGQRATLADVGSGAGLPGIVIALARPELSITLIEPIPRRAQFLNETLAELGLTKQVTTLKSKAEKVRTTYNYVTARALAPLPRLLESTWHLVKPGGQLLAIKGASVEGEIAGLTLPQGAALELKEINTGINLDDLPSGRVVAISKAG